MPKAEWSHLPSQGKQKHGAAPPAAPAGTSVQGVLSVLEPKESTM